MGTTLRGFRPGALYARLVATTRPVATDLGNTDLTMRTSVYIVPLAALFLLCGLVAMGPSETLAGTESAFDAADTNDDDLIDQEEWDRFSSELFDDIDRDADGSASAEELDKAYESFDYNKDGVIDGEEAPLVIILGDADEDGQVTRKEFEAIDWNRPSIDADGDGRLSRDEFRRAQREIHDEADFDRSTTLGRSEYNGSPSLTLFRF